ncbi:probable methyltransferase-like protein 24 [Daphnia carinata]|uniref:probable methyltransferase-like protein 24 n=1 Tax=Daphnia carinata TaxID=120202 RepID=UPI00257CD59C|nr:probable methyltransferase-like protein 24 [Daphnia carinata]
MNRKTMCPSFNLVNANRKASVIFMAMIVAVIVTWLVHRNPRPLHDEAQKDHVSSSQTACIDGHDPWTNSKKSTESMSAQEMYQYLRWTNSSACQNAVDIGFSVMDYKGVIASDGNKAVCFDRSITPDAGNCLVYSFGINNEWSFEDAMAKFSCQVYAFDPSMNVSDHDRSQFIHFFRLGLDGQDRLHPSKGWQMRTVTSIYDMLKSQHGELALIDVLKIDVEFAEWDALPQMANSGFLADKVKQLVVEIHLEADVPLQVLRHRVQIIRNLEAKVQGSVGGFVRFSSRPNPFFPIPAQVSQYKKGEIFIDLAWYNSRYFLPIV